MVYCAGALSSGFCALSFVVVGEYGWCAGEILDIEQVAFGSGMQGTCVDALHEPVRGLEQKMHSILAQASTQ